MAHWVVIVQFGNDGVDDNVCEEVTRFEDTGDRARARLYEIACTHLPRKALRQQAREVYRIGDGDAYYTRIKGRVSTFLVTYRLAELVWSTGPEQKRPWR
ncbi:hypothetical protein [Streptomyces sp. SAI-041]|uniref:hypothetical protein n=1 Tax=Streptomyces sp. SAI-041 TaxID=2940548 RepID=UPI0024743BFF|nr:hypothetical protein [Streptomyces sp. SAI-041]MDH6548241.1 hypothetical protein [Streptomyces sp. SAI-041]